MFEHRVEARQHRLKDENVGVAVIMPGANFGYFTGYPMVVSECPC